MAVIDIIKEKAKADKKTIVLPESMDRRTWEAAEKILKEGLANLIIIGTRGYRRAQQGLRCFRRNHHQSTDLREDPGIYRSLR